MMQSDDICDYCELKNCWMCEIDEIPLYHTNFNGIEVEPVRHGHWIFDKNGLVHAYYRCSECDLTVPDGDIYKFCPWCGAKMDGDE